jgi:hypothetical protein
MTKPTDLVTSFSEEDLTVYFNNKPLVVLNGYLAERQAITKEQLIKLKELHIDRHLIEQQLEQAHRVEDIQMLFKEWTRLQFRLQENWNFPKNADFHPSHRLPHCSCGATMDNDERLGTPFRVVTIGCPIHDPI